VFDLAAAWRASSSSSSSFSSKAGDGSGGDVWRRRLVEGSDSPLCEVLGQRQRRWLRSALARSRAPLRLVASGSVLLGSLLYGEQGEKERADDGEDAASVRRRPQVCSGDDWLCWSRAQLNFLHTLANATAAGHDGDGDGEGGEAGGGGGGGGGCVVVLTGDYHYSDIKVARPAAATAAAADAGAADAAPPSSSSSPAKPRPPPPPAAARALRLDRLARPVYQLMASGLTDSTASQHSGRACEGTYREDLAGLRPLGRCSFVARPAFGGVEVDWSARWFELSVRDAEGGDVAVGEDGVRQRVRVSLDTCEIIEQG
jgi:alkaline phosphatase D